MNENNIDVCLSMLEIAWEGNITPIQWYRRLRHKDGKPNVVAITILSDLCYWHRPALIRDEIAGEVTGYRKRFKGEKLQRSYGYYSDLFGFSTQQSRLAIAYLEEEKLIEKEVVKKLTLPTGQQLFNVMYLTVCPDQLKLITKVKTHPLFYRTDPLLCRTDKYKELDLSNSNSEMYVKSNSRSSNYEEKENSKFLDELGDDDF